MSRILIVDDHEVVRHGVRTILETQDDWEVAGEAANGREAVDLYHKLKPDAVVMDITMPLMNGLDATDRITRESPDAKVLIFTMHEEPTVVPLAQKVGARGLLAKSRAATELTPALKTILAGNTYFPDGGASMESHTVAA